MKWVDLKTGILKAMKLKKSKINMNKLSDKQLKLRAAGIIFTIFTISDMALKEMLAKIEELKKLNEEDKEKILLIVSYVTLYNAQKLFWKNIISDEKSIDRFAYYLYGLFEKVGKFDPKPYIKDLIDYVEEGKSSKEVQYIGSKICRELNKEDAFLMLKISTVYSLLLIHGGKELLKKSCEIPLENDELKQILEKIEK